MEVVGSYDSARVAFSVIIPVHNRARQLAECLVSVRAQTLRDFELIVVDDGSTDGTCDGLAAADNLTVVTKSNGGPASARNVGAEKARGRYLFFLDSDDLAFPWTLSTFAAAIAGGDKPDVICGNFVEFRGTPPVLKQAERDVTFYRNYLEAARNGLYAAGGMIAVKRDVFLAAGGFDVGMKVAEDHDLMLRLGERPGFAHIVSPPTYAKHEHAGSISKILELFRPGFGSLIEHLNAGAYGTGARASRLAAFMVSRHVRSAIVTLARNGLTEDGWDLYRRAFVLNLRMGRLKFLLTAPVLLILGKFAQRAR